MHRWTFGLLSVCILAFTAPIHADLIKHDNPQWDVIVDEVYLQEIPTLIPTDIPLTAVVVYRGDAYVGCSLGVSKVVDGALKHLDNKTGGVTHLEVYNDAIWAITEKGLWRYNGKALTQITDQPVTDICAHDGQVVVLMNQGLYAVDDDSLTEITKDGVRNAKQVESYSGTLYVHDGQRIGFLDLGAVTYNYTADWGTLERGATIRDMMAVGSRLYLATDEGLGVLRGMTWYSIQGDEGLPYEDTTSLATGFDRDLWIGTTQGAIRNVKDDYQYFNHQRWLPNDKVNGVASGDSVVYIATEGGLSIINYEPYTLAKKAAYYERWL